MNAEVLARLKQRGMTVKELARLANVDRAHASAAFDNAPGRGAQTRRKLAEWLTHEELAAAGWDEFGNVRKAIVRSPEQKAATRERLAAIGNGQ